MIYRCFISHQTLQIPETILDESTFHHLIKVLRLKNNELVEIMTGNGEIYEGTLTIINKKSAKLSAIKLIASSENIRKNLKLYIGITKLNTLDLIIQKATELGVCEIQPIIAEFTPVKKSLIFSDQKQQHWQKIIQSSVVQSRNPWLPKLHPAIAITDLSLNAQTLALHPYANHIKPTALPDVDTLLVGPEGGWSDNEVEHLLSQNALVAALDTPILRAETAVVAGLTLLKTY